MRRTVVSVCAVVSLSACTGGGASKTDPQATSPGAETETDPSGGASPTDKVAVDEDANADSSIDPSGDKGVELTGGTVNLAVVSAGSLAISSLMLEQPTPVGQMASPPVNGVGLESLMYRISSIQMCEDVTTNGTGFSNTKNCVEIYRNDSGDYDTFGYDEAKADTTNYVDLLDPEDVKRLSASLVLKSSHVGEYNFGLINWFQPFKVKGSVKLSDDTVLYTKDAPIVEEADQNDIIHHLVKVDNITTGPADLGIQRHDNGGAWFKFAKPFVISKADIEDKRDFKLDLVFNADGIVKAYEGRGNGMIGGAKPFDQLVEDTDKVYSIEVPMIGLTPIAHPVDKKVVKEQYLAHYHEDYPWPYPPHATVTEDFDIRIELYSLKDDPAQSIYGADIEVLNTADTFRPAGNIYDPFFVKEGENGEVILQTFDKGSIFKDFRRLASPGDTGTLKLVSGMQGESGYCLPPDMDPTTGCSSTTRDVSLEYTLVSRAELP